MAPPPGTQSDIRCTRVSNAKVIWIKDKVAQHLLVVGQATAPICRIW